MLERLARMTRPHRILVPAAVTGVLVGLAVAAFDQVVGRWLLAWTLDLPAGLRDLAPAVGVALAWLALQYIGRGASPSLSDEHLDAHHRNDGDVPGGPVAGKTTAAVATLGLGGACGFEGPSIHLGTAIGSFLRRRFPRTVTGAVFSLEVPYQEDSASHAVLPRSSPRHRRT
jgi:H+/Cl- antiporter ClcA